MKNNLPEKIYLDLGVNPDHIVDFNELVSVTWSKDNATDGDIEFVRKDVAESETIATIIAFADWYDKTLNPQEFQNGKWMNESNARNFLTAERRKKNKK